MSWRKLTEEDLASRLSVAEIEAYSKSNCFTANPADTILTNVTEEARGFIASGRKCRLGPEGTLPQMLVSSALSIAVVELLTRISRKVNEDRSKARDNAYSLLNKIAAGEVVPEDYGEAPKETDKVATAPAYAPPKPARLLD